MEEIKVSEMLQAESINKDDSVMIIQEGVNKKAGGSIETATGTSLSLNSVYDTATIKSNSKNLFDGFMSGAYASTTGVWNGSADGITSKKIPVVNGNKYTLSGFASGQTLRVFYWNNGTYVGDITITTASSNTITMSGNQFSFQGSSSISYSNVQFEAGETATEYNPYNTKVGIGVEELQLEDGSIAGIDGQPISAENRRRSANFITIDATKQHIINTGSYQLSVYQYKEDGTFLESSQGWQNSPYTLTPNVQTGKIKLVIPNSNAKVYDISIDDIKPQVITLTPNEEKVVFTYDTKTIVEGNGNITITYNKQARLLNNDDLVVDEIENLQKEHCISVGTSIDNNYKVNIIHNKNLMNCNNFTSYSATNVNAFAKITDGKLDYVSATKTASTSGNIFITLSIFTLNTETGTYILSGCPSGGSNDTYQLYLKDNTTDADITPRDNGSGANVTLTKGHKYTCYLRCASSATFTDKQFQPMLRYTRENDIYEPYVTPSINVGEYNIYSSGVVLYENASGNNDTITLSDVIENYKSIDIFFKPNTTDGRMGYSRYDVGFGSGLCNLMSASCDTGHGLYIRAKDVALSGNTISNSGTRYTAVVINGNSQTVNQLNNEIYICKVVGYR